MFDQLSYVRSMISAQVSACNHHSAAAFSDARPSRSSTFVLDASIISPDGWRKQLLVFAGCFVHGLCKQSVLAVVTAELPFTEYSPLDLHRLMLE